MPALVRVALGPWISREGIEFNWPQHPPADDL